MRTMTFAAMLAVSIPGPVRAEVPEVQHLRLRAEATVHGDVPTLGDVLVLDGIDARLIEAIAAQPVYGEPAPRAPRAVSHREIVQRLDALGVNLSRVLVSGALTCEIHMVRPAPPDENEVGAGNDADAGDLVRSQPPAPATSARALADELTAMIDAEVAALHATAEIRFERAGQGILDLTTPPFEFRIVAPGREKTGLRSFRVTIRQAGQTERKVDVFAHVRLRRSVVVAARPLNPGNFVGREDVAVESRLFDDAPADMPARVEEVIGQQIKRFVPIGEVVRRDAIKPVELVRRSRPVTVIGASEHVQLRLSGVALDSGAYGDTVRVRMGSTRQTQRVVRGVVSSLATVRLLESGS